MNLERITIKIDTDDILNSTNTAYLGRAEDWEVVETEILDDTTIEVTLHRKEWT